MSRNLFFPIFQIFFSKCPDREPEFPDASEEHIPDLILRTESFSGRLPVLYPRKTGAFHKADSITGPYDCRKSGKSNATLFFKLPHKFYLVRMNILQGKKYLRHIPWHQKHTGIPCTAPM